jgi:hypothetical protein
MIYNNEYCTVCNTLLFCSKPTAKMISSPPPLAEAEDLEEVEMTTV